MQKIKAYVTMFNRLTWAKKYCEDLAAAGLEVILIDNNSTYPPLLEWYKDCPYEVIRMKENHWAWVYFTHVRKLGDDRFVIVTDSDLDISEVPLDWPEVLMNGLTKNKVRAWKAGLSIEINDLPDNELVCKVVEHEREMWQTKRTPEGFYVSSMDVGLALYDFDFEGGTRGIGKPFWYDAIRAPRPYVMRHLDWYLTKETVTEEDLYYLKSATYPGWGSKWMELIYNK